MSPSIFIRAGFVLFLGGLTGCAAIGEGTWQKITVNTEPSDAACVVSRDGETLAEIASTPGSLLVTKNFSDLRIACKKPGYQDSLHFNKSEVATAAVLSFLFIGPSALQLDAQAGAVRKYDPEVLIPLGLPGEPAKPLKILEPAQAAGPLRPTPALTATSNPAQPLGRTASVPPRPASRRAPTPALSSIPSEQVDAPQSAGAVSPAPSPTPPPPEIRPVAAQTPLSTPAQTETKLVIASTPTEAKPAEVKPTETKPAESRSVEAKPTETKPAESRPVEAKPAETKPIESRPAANSLPLIVATAPSNAPISVASEEPPPLSAHTLRRLTNLKEIFDRKALTQDEYDRKRLAVTKGG